MAGLRAASALLLVVAASAQTHSFLKLPTPAHLRGSRPLLRGIYNPCNNLTAVDKTTLHWTLPILPPWDTDVAMVYKAPVFDNLFKQNVLVQRVPGLPGDITFEATFAIFQNEGCFVFPHGGSVRDFLLGLSPKDIDVEFSCNATTMIDICAKSFGQENCFIADQYIQLGHADPTDTMEELEGVEMSVGMYGPLFSKEFSANALTYDLNTNMAIIDVTGRGVKDVCSRTISIPVPKDEWEEWRDESHFMPHNGLKKLPRFWKLRSAPKLFNATTETTAFIVDSVKAGWANASYPLGTMFRKFYCSMAGGSLYGGKHCIVDHEATASTMSKILSYSTALQEDFGAEWFQTNIEEAGFNSFQFSSHTDITVSDTFAVTQTAATTQVIELPHIAPALWRVFATGTLGDGSFATSCEVMVAPQGSTTRPTVFNNKDFNFDSDGGVQGSCQPHQGGNTASSAPDSAFKFQLVVTPLGTPPLNVTWTARAMSLD